MRLFRMGSTGKDAGGFVSNDLDYHGRYIWLIIGNVTKPSSKDFQISFVFSVTGCKCLSVGDLLKYRNSVCDTTLHILKF
jgi:hypothetical protein